MPSARDESLPSSLTCAFWVDVNPLRVKARRKFDDFLGTDDSRRRANNHTRSKIGEPHNSASSILPDSCNLGVFTKCPDAGIEWSPRVVRTIPIDDICRRPRLIDNIAAAHCTRVALTTITLSSRPWWSHANFGD